MNDLDYLHQILVERQNAFRTNLNERMRKM